MPLLLLDGAWQLLLLLHHNGAWELVLVLPLLQEGAWKLLLQLVFAASCGVCLLAWQPRLMWLQPLGGHAPPVLLACHFGWPHRCSCCWLHVCGKSWMSG